MSIRYQGLHSLDDLVFLVNKPIIGKKGIHYQKLLKDWSSIVGNDISRYAIPTKISTSRRSNNSKAEGAKFDNILYLATNNAAASTELVYHLGVLKEQINFYFGYEYIQQIKLVQAVFQVHIEKELPMEKKLSVEQKSKLEELTSQYGSDDEIKAILTAMATRIITANIRSNC